MKREALVGDRRHGARGNKQGEKGRESFQISRTKRTAALPCDCLRQRRTEKGGANSLLPRCQTKKLADSNRAKNAQSIGLTFGFSSRPRSGISCAAEE
jgi:hypothetical protein